MANTTIKLKRSGITGNTPGSLNYGEIALNYFDGKIFYKDSSNIISHITNQQTFDTINANSTLIFATSSSDVLSIIPGNNITISACTVTKSITIESIGAKDAYDQANAAHYRANLAYANADVGISIAQIAYNQANTGTTIAQMAYAQANAAYTQSNNSFIIAQNSYAQANAAYTQANVVITLAQNSYSQANLAHSTANSKAYIFFQSTPPTSSNNRDFWTNSDTGVVYENFGNTSFPIWAEFGPTAITSNTSAATITGYSVTSSNGIYSTGSYTGNFTDGIVLDYINGSGRISVGNNDGIIFFNGGISTNSIFNITSSGQIITNYRPTTTVNAAVQISATNTKGGVGYSDVLHLINGSSGATNINKFIRLNNVGSIEIIDSTYENGLFMLTNSGNMSTKGTITPGAYTAGQVIKDIMLSNSEVNVISTTIAPSGSTTNFVTYNYTPSSSSSYLLIYYHLSKYSPAGTTDDSWYSQLLVDGTEISYGWQMVNDNGTGTSGRSGVLFPLTGRYTNSSTSTKQIQVAARRDSADDGISIENSATSMWLRITEIAR